MFFFLFEITSISFFLAFESSEDSLPKMNDFSVGQWTPGKMAERFSDLKLSFTASSGA